MKPNPPAIRSIRTRSGYSVRSLATLAGIAPSTLSRIEAGTYDGRPDTIRRIAKALDVPLTAIATVEAAA